MGEGAGFGGGRAPRTVNGGQIWYMVDSMERNEKFGDGNSVWIARIYLVVC